MYKPKFGKGDVIVPEYSKIQMFERINDSFIKIKSRRKINNTYYYTLSGDYDFGFNKISESIFPAVNIDKCYKLDNIYLRKEKLNKIIYKTKNKVK